MHKIGDDIAERVDMIPPGSAFWSPGGALSDLSGKHRPDSGPGSSGRGGLPTEALVATASWPRTPIIFRFTARPRSMLAGASHSTARRWPTGAWFLQLLRERFVEHARGSTKLFADETSGRGRTKTGQLWAYARDDRPWPGADPPPRPTSTRPTTRPNTRLPISKGSVVSSRLIAMLAIEL
jgi:transposase